MKKQTFETFMKKVDLCLEGICYMGSGDLPDYRYYDCWEDCMTPKETALEALEYAGFPLEDMYYSN